MKRFPTVAALALALLLSTSLLQSKGPSDTDKIWVVIRPVQCLENPWEKEWMKRHRQRADKYPRKQEFSILKTYFAKRKIPILEVRVKPYVTGDPTCRTCNCPRGDTVYLLTYARYAPALIKLGYTQRVPAPNIDSKS